MFAFHPISSHAQAQVEQNEQIVKPQVQNAEKTLTTVLVMGDSLSAGYGIDVNKGWVKLLAQKFPKLTFINASISGETTSGGKQRLPRLLAQHKPDIMILELGANDALRGQNLFTSKANLEAMINMCQTAENNCDVILLGVQLPTNYGPAYDALFQKMYSALAKENSLVFDPFFLEPVALEPEMMQSDGLHPTELAQPIITQRVNKLLMQLLNNNNQ